MSIEQFSRCQIFQQISNAQMMSYSSIATLAQITPLLFYFATTCTWVIYPGASDHMTENKSIQSTLNSISLLLPVTLADGYTSYTEGVGTANDIPSLSLSSVLYALKFPFNLLLVSSVRTIQ